MHYQNIPLFKTLFTPKRSKVNQANAGFTMIELLVGAILAFLIISPLMGFVVSILNDDKREAAKTASDQEIQAALDFITEDLNQAIYIYDRDGVEALIENDREIAPDNKVPILVFWKRKFERRVLPVFDGATCPGQCDDTFVYSLVIYYATQDNSQIWNENTARIERREVSDGVQNPFNAGEFLIDPDPAYNDFDSENWTAWEKAADFGQDSPVEVLVDYIDVSAEIELPDDYCTNALGIVDNEGNPNNPQLISDQSIERGNNISTYGFYACVDTLNNIIQVNLRSNALERIDAGAEYNENRQAFFPTGSVVIRGFGGFGE